MNYVIIVTDVSFYCATLC